MQENIRFYYDDDFDEAEKRVRELRRRFIKMFYMNTKRGRKEPVH